MVILVLLAIAMIGCKNQKLQNDKLEKENMQIVRDTFPEYKEKIVKDYVYKALDEAKKGITCDSNINEKINNYLISQQIDASECDHKDILTYYNYLIKNKNDDAYKFLMKNKYISEEA